MGYFDLTPNEGLNVEVGLLLAVLEDATFTWRRELGELSADALVWQPFPGSHSIGAVLLHIADVEADWIHEVAAGQTRDPDELVTLLSAETQQFDVQWPVPPRQPLAWYLEQQDRIRARTRSLVAELNDPLHPGDGGEHTYALRWVLSHVIVHEAYHGGQAVFLSLMHAHHQSKM